MEKFVVPNMLMEFEFQTGAVPVDLRVLREDLLAIFNRLKGNEEATEEDYLKEIQVNFQTKYSVAISLGEADAVKDYLAALLTKKKESWRSDIAAMRKSQITTTSTPSETTQD